VGRLSVHDGTPTLEVLLAVQVTVNHALLPSPVCGAQLVAPIGPVVRTGHVVVFHPLAASGVIGTQLPVGVLSTLTGVQVVVVNVLMALGNGAGVQEATGTSVVTFGGGQVMVTQLFASAPVCGVHTATGSLLTLLSAQTIVFQPLPASPDWSVQVCTGALATLLLPQTVWIQSGPVAGGAVHEATPTAGVVIGDGQAMLVQLLPSVAATGVHEATKSGPLVTGVGQVVVVQSLPSVGPEAVQDSTGTFSWSLVPHRISTQLFPADGVWGVHVATGTLAVFDVQVTATHPLAELAGSGTHVPDWTGVLTTTVLQSVRWWLFAPVAGTGVHEPTIVGPLTRVSAGQVVVVQLFAPVGPDGVQESTATLFVSLLPQEVVVYPLADVGP
jgi:hypothetical protein